MYSQLYKPKKLEELTFNHEITSKLEHIGPYSFIIYGNAGSGKLTRVHCYLQHLFGDGIYQTKHHQFTLSKGIDITYKVSNYHLEITPANYGINDRAIMTEFIEELSSMHNVVTNGHKFFLIKEADKLTPEAQSILVHIIDKHYKTAKFILLCKSISRVDAQLRSRFLLLRNPAPHKADVDKILKTLATKLEYKLSPKAIGTIIESSKHMSGQINLNQIINIFQMSFITGTGKYSKYDIQIVQYMNRLISLIEQKLTCELIDEIRKVIYSIYESNINLSIVMVYLCKYFMHTIKTETYRQKVAELAAHYELLMNNGNKESLYLETFALRIIEILRCPDIVKVKLIKIKKPITTPTPIPSPMEE